MGLLPRFLCYAENSFTLKGKDRFVKGGYYV